MATGDILAVRIIGSTATCGASANGWVAEIDLDGLSTGGTYNFGFGANNDPSTAKIVFTVTSPGYDTSGGTTTIQRTVYGTQWLRKPYPHSTCGSITCSVMPPDESTSGGVLTVRVAVSDFIYSGDTATVSIASGFYTGSNAVTGLSCTINSTRGYPKPVGRWAWPAYERATGDFLVEATVFHRFARNGKPLAAVKFTATDEHSNTVTVTATDMTVSTRTGDANKVLVYAASIPVTSLTQGDVVTVNFTAYPWVGDSSAKLNSDLVANGGDGFAQPVEQLGPLAFLLDKTGAYGTPFAVVDPTNGQASTASTWVYTSQSAAESAYASAATNSYTTIGNAAQALKTYNNANYGHNDPGGGTILLATSANTYPGTIPAGDLGAQKTWLTVTRVSTVAKASAVITAGVLDTLKAQKIKMYDIALVGTSAALMYGRTASDVMWLDGCDINSTGAAGFYSWKMGYATRNAITALTNGLKHYSTVKLPWALIRGNSGPASPLDGEMYAVLGNTNVSPNTAYGTGNGQGQQISTNVVAAFNRTNLNSSESAINVFGLIPSTTDTNSVAVVQNVLENRTSVAALTSIAAQSQQVNGADNVLLWHNTVAGARSNQGYNGYGSTSYLHTNYSYTGNSFEGVGHHPDDGTAFDSAASRSGSFAVEYGVGMTANHIHSDLGGMQFIGCNTVFGGSAVLGYVNDKSYTGDALGGGDYHLTALSTALNRIPTGAAVLPYDLDGIARRNDGTGAAGAYEYAAAGSAVPVFMNQYRQRWG